MHDDSELAELLLVGNRFDDQPVCWQNMVIQLKSRTNPFTWMWRAHSEIQDYLAQWNLTYVMKDDHDMSKVRGTRSNLTAWMLAHA